MFYGGKGEKGKFLYCDLNARINVFEMGNAFQNSIRDRYGDKKYREKLSNKAKEAGIAIENKQVAIYINGPDSDIDQYSEMCRATPAASASSKQIIGDKNGDFNSNSINIMEIEPESPIFIPYNNHTYYEIHPQHNKRKNCCTATAAAAATSKSTSKKRTVKTILHNMSKEDKILYIEKACPLCADFFHDFNSVSHNDECKIASSLAYVEGGKDIFLGYYHGTKNWCGDWDYFTKGLPWGCNTHDKCKYWEQCQGPTIYARLSKKIIKIKHEHFIPIEEATANLNNCIASALESNDSDIHIIRAQTAIGKTSAYDAVHKAVTDITKDPKMKIITFKKYNADPYLYFGKVEGVNTYAGDDIAVIGTPHNFPAVYMLIGAYLGYNTDTQMISHYIENSEYRFKIMTYEDEDMRNLQLYFLYTDLEQAVGRARLLRYDCKVYLFSNLPLPQAELIQDPYLPDKTEN